MRSNPPHECQLSWSSEAPDSPAVKPKAAQFINEPVPAARKGARLILYREGLCDGMWLPISLTDQIGHAEVGFS